MAEAPPDFPIHVAGDSVADGHDPDVSGLPRPEYDLTTAGDRLVEVIDRTVNGRLTAAEAIGHREFSLTKLYPST